MTEPSTQNDFLIGSNGRTLAPMLPVAIATRQQAYRTAAWLLLMGVTLPDEDPASTFDEVRDAIANT